LLDDTVPVSFQAGPDLRRPGRQNFSSYHNYHVPRRQLVLVSAKAFAEQAFQCVTLYRPGDLLACDRKAEARTFTFSDPDQDGYTVVAATKIVFKYLLKIDRAGKSQPSWKRLADSIGHFTA